MASEEQPRPAADTHLHIVDDEGVLFSESRQTLHLLNTAATFAWIQLEEGLSRAAVEASLVRTFGFDGTAARDHLEALLVNWRASGLLDGGEAGSAERRRGARPHEEPPGIKAIPLREAFTRWYRLLDSAVRVDYGDAARQALCHPVIAHFEIAPGDAPRATIVLRGEGDETHLHVDGHCREQVPRLDALAPQVKAAVMVAAINAHPHLLNIHCGCVAGRDGVLLLPAAAGSGKSTLTAGLAHAGYGYLSDESAVLEEPAMTLRPLPLALCSKESAWPIIDGLFPEHAGLQAHHRLDGKRVRYLPPAALPRVADDRPWRPTHMVFPKYRAGQPAGLSPLSRGEALRRLFDECISIPRWLEPQQVSALVDWLRQVECYDASIDRLADGVDLMRSVLGPPPDATEQPPGGGRD